MPRKRNEPSFPVDNPVLSARLRELGSEMGLDVDQVIEFALWLGVAELGRTMNAIGYRDIAKATSPNSNEGD
jgi:hypothetical protein